jgi:PAS domain S-box-containing protein
MVIGPAAHAISRADYLVAVLSSLDGNAAILDSEGRIVAVNEAWARFGCENGGSPSSIGVGINYLEVCRSAAGDSETSEAVYNGLLSVLNGTATIFRHDYRCDAPQVLRWFRVTVTPWHAQSGYVLVLHSDISEDRLPAEIQNRTLKSVRAMVWNADAPSFRTTFLSGQVEEILGFSLQAWLDDSDLWNKQLHPKDRDWVLEYSHKAVQEGRDHEFDYRMIDANGRTIWLHQVVSVVCEPGQPMHLAGISFDISELKQAQERLKILGGRILKAQDEERSRIARELHDDIGQRLALVGMDLARMEMARGELTNEFHGEVAKTKTRIVEIANDIRALSHGLHSHILDSRGLVSASEEFCRELSSRRNINIKFRSEGVPIDTPNSTHLGIFRVLQEALQNAVKHSGAKTFEVTLLGNSHDIELTVQDDGRGFDPKEALKRRGLGLTAMEERITLVGGEFSIETGPSGGTTIRASVPIDSHVEAQTVPEVHLNVGDLPKS